MLVTKKNNKVMLGDAAYAFGKKLVQLILPAFASLYYGLASIWHLPAAGQVVGTTAIVTTFLGTVLHVSSAQFDSSGAAHDGTMVVTSKDDGNKLYSFELNDHPSTLADKNTVSFKVDNQAPAVTPSTPPT